MTTTIPVATSPTGDTDAQTRFSRHHRARGLRLRDACLLFAFIGTFTYVNFVLVRPPFSVGMMTLGFVYFVFLPSILTTPLAGRLVARVGTRPALWAAFALAAAGLPLLLGDNLSLLLAGLALIAVGTFFAQAVATGFVSRAATSDRGSASGIYLASYFLGGLAGSAVLGQVFDRLGWLACVIGIGIALALGALLATRLVIAEGHRADATTAFQKRAPAGQSSTTH